MGSRPPASWAPAIRAIRGGKKLLLDLPSWSRWLAPPRGLDDVGVVVGELKRRGSLLGDVIERRDRRPDAEQEPDDPAAEPERLGDAAGKPPPQPRLEGGQSLGHDLGPQRGRRLELGREIFRAGQAHELGAVDVDYVEGDRDARYTLARQLTAVAVPAASGLRRPDALQPARLMRGISVWLVAR